RIRARALSSRGPGRFHAHLLTPAAGEAALRDAAQAHPRRARRPPRPPHLQAHLTMALVELRIADLAVLRSVSLVPGEGLTALTGETGSGKSLCVTGLRPALGGRVD